MKKHHVSLLLQAFALAVIWVGLKGEIGTITQIVASVIAVVAIRGAFGELK
jgi:hypothetical protein